MRPAPRPSGARRPLRSKPGKPPATKKQATRTPVHRSRTRVRRSAGTRAASAAPTTTWRDRALALFRFAHQTTGRWARDIRDGQRVAQLAPTSNHVLWCLGHLALSNAWFASALDGQPVGVREAWDRLFDMGSRPVADLSAHPDPDEVRGLFEQTARRIEEAVSRLTDDDLLGSCACDTGGFCTDTLDALPQGRLARRLASGSDRREPQGAGPALGDGLTPQVTCTVIGRGWWETSSRRQRPPVARVSRSRMARQRGSSAGGRSMAIRSGRRASASRRAA